MKIFRNAVLRNASIIIILFSFFLSCNQISEGMQRKKFEFLYKMNNYAAMYREFTNSIIYFSDLKQFSIRMDKFYQDINKIETIDGWGTSRVIKEKFLTLIDENTESAHQLSQKKFLPTENIRKEYDVIIMNERVENFIQELNDEISKVGKE